MFYHAALFAGGALFGTAGLKILGSREAKKLYSHAVAAAIRAKDVIMAGVDNIRECGSDILADAKDINEERAQEIAEAIFDAEEEPVEENTVEESI